MRVGLILYAGFPLQKFAAIFDLFSTLNGELQPQRVPHERLQYCLELLSDEGGSVESGERVKIWTDRFVSSQARAYRRLFRLERDSFSILTVHGEQHNAVSIGMRYGSLEAPKDLVKDVLGLLKEDLGAEEGRRLGVLVKRRFGLNAHLCADKSSEDDKIRSSAIWLINQPFGSVTIEDAALQLSMSPRTYLRRFKATFGTSPSEFNIDTRLDQVCDLVKHSDLPIKKIARDCGFRDASHLSRLFKARRSISLTQYRQSLGG